MADGELTRRAIASQPAWLRAVPRDRRLPGGRVLATGCGTSFHAAQTTGAAAQALELVACPGRGAEVDLRAGQDHLRLLDRAHDPQVGEVGHAGVLAVGEIDGVVDVTPRVEIAVAHRLVVHVGEALHRR